MTMTLSEKLDRYGIDFKDAMERFEGNAGLYERLAMKYLDDRHFVSLIAALEVKDFDTAYEQAHALKGAAGNLSFKTLYDRVSSVSKELKIGEIADAESHIPDVAEAHDLVVVGLEDLQNGRLTDGLSLEEYIKINGYE